ncbi:MAG: antitoxin Xre/MbcA/ParS toxin-binding domain-containing protein, partial [Pseudomonadota bacterium]
FDAPHPKADQPQVPSGTALRGRVSGPVQVLAKLKTSWDLSEAELAILLGFEDVRLVRDLLSGVTSLRGPDMKARFRYLFWIYEALFQLFEDEATERAWLRKSAPGLEGKSPIQVMLQGEIEDLLTVKQFVEYVAGR